MALAPKPDLQDQRASLDEVGSYSVSGLALTWDNCPEVRQRLRLKYSLLIHHCTKLGRDSNCKVEKNVMNVRKNSFVLKPVLELIRTHGALPAIDALDEQVELLFGLHSTKLGPGIAREQAWAIRHLMSALKKNKENKKDMQTFTIQQSFRVDRSQGPTLVIQGARNLPS